MKQRTFLLFALFTFSSASLFAQDEKIETDRPGETQTVALTKKGYFQAEFGLRKEQQNSEDYTFFHPRAQLKYGLSSRFELRAELTAATEKQYSNQEFRHGLQPVEVGLKAKLLEQKGALPATTFYTQIGIPNWASKDHQEEHLSPKFRLLFENKLTDKIKLTYNAGAEWKVEGAPPQWLYTLAPEVEISEKWDAFVETFAFLQSGQAPQHSIDGGFAYYATNNVKLDVWAGKGLSKEAPDYFIAGGISFRFK
ncbi:MAG: transporter [Bacteroidota bacterium]|nr:transporter [Bacteroidota bacterium]